MWLVASSTIARVKHSTALTNCEEWKEWRVLCIVSYNEEHKIRKGSEGLTFWATKNLLPSSLRLLASFLSSVATGAAILITRKRGRRVSFEWTKKAEK